MRVNETRDRVDLWRVGSQGHAAGCVRVAAPGGPHARTSQRKRARACTCVRVDIERRRNRKVREAGGDIKEAEQAQLQRARTHGFFFCLDLGLT